MVSACFRGAKRTLPIFCLVAFPLSCNGDPPAQNPFERVPTPTPNFEEVPCGATVRNAVTQCGIVSVPEGAGSDREIRVAVARVFSRESQISDDPVVYLEGGPGVEVLSRLPSLYATVSPLAPHRDFIFFDQRGVGESGPALSCNGLVDELDACFSQWDAQVDLRHYNTASIAADVDSIRAALGYDKWNLLGVSHGTRIALTIMRDHPTGVRSAVLDSVVPVEADFLGQLGLNSFDSLRQVFSACAGQAACAESYPTLESDFIDFVEMLNQAPLSLPKAGGGQWTLDATLFVEAIRGYLYSPRSIEWIPALIDGASNGDFRLLGELVAAETWSNTIGMHLSVQCSEEWPFSSRESLEEFDSRVPEPLRHPLSGAEYWDFCERWPVAASPPLENKPVVSDVDTLILSGAYDPITPRRFAEAVHTNLENSFYFNLDNESHGVSRSSCGRALVRSFLERPARQPSSECVEEPRLLRFLGAPPSDP